jgi:hypothetical protein
MSGKLTRMIQLKARNAFPVEEQRRFSEFAELSAVQEGFQDVLLDIQIVVDDGGHLLAELWKILHGLLDAVVGDIVGGWLGAQVEMISHVLLDETAAVVAADDRIGQVQVLDHRLKLATILPGDSTAKDGRDLVGLADGAISVQEAFSQRVQSGASMEDQIVAVLYLSKEQTMLAPRLLAFAFCKETA